MSDGRSARRARIGGRWAVSVRGVVVVAAFSLIATTLRGIRHGREGAIAALVAWAVGMLVFSVVTVIADRTAFRNRRAHPVPAWWVVAYGVIGGIAVALVAAPVNDALTTTPTPSLPTALMVTTGLMTLLITASAAVFTEIDDGRQRRAAVLRQAVELRRQDTARAALGESIREAVQDEIDEATRGIRDQLARAEAETDAAIRADFAIGLTNAVDRDLRPLSQRLGSASSAPIPSPGFWASARALLAALQVQPVATGVAIGLAGLAFLAPDTPEAEAALRGITIGALTWAGLTVTRLLVRRRPHLRNVEVALGSVVVTALGVINFLVSKATYAADRSWTQLVGIVVLFPLATAIVAVSVRTLTEGTPRVRAMEFAVDERQLDALAANREFVRVSRELAQYVHGTLQSHLLATAFAIENASQSGDPAAVGAAIESARRAFDMSAPRALQGQSLSDALQRQVALWDGFVEISVDIHEQTPTMAPADVARVAAVVEEAISNARKHGGARAVQVSVAPSDTGAVLVTVRDDGAGPVDGPAGMGSMLITEATNGDWTIAATPTGAVLTAVIPVGSPAATA